MSIDALKYVKDVRMAPNGEPVSLREKAILWYLANAHNEEKRYAYPAVKTIATSNNISERTVQEILKELIRKGVIWRRQAYRENGSLTSNEYRFVAIDGEPTTADLLAEEQRSIRGEMMAKAARENRKAGEISTDECENQREISHQAGAEDCATLVRNPAPPSAETCATLARKPALPSAETCATLVRDPAPPELQVELPGKDSQNPQGTKLESSDELQAAAGTEENVNRENGFAHVWSLILAELASCGALTEEQFLRLSVGTTQTRTVLDRGSPEIEIGISPECVPLNELWPSLSDDLRYAQRQLNLSGMTITFAPGEVVRRA